jgi:hypothetical protein
MNQDGASPAGNHLKGERQQRRPPMNILKRALLACLRVAFIGALKLSLFTYILFLPDAAVASAAPESNGHVGGTAPDGNSNATIG